MLDQLDRGTPEYNIPMRARLNGQLDITALERSIDQIMIRQESLRTRFGVLNGDPVQIVEEHREFGLPLVDVTGLGKENGAIVARRLAGEDAATGFDLQKAPLIRAMLVRIDEDDHMLVVTFHHIVSDGWSLTVFMNELEILYERYSKGTDRELSRLNVQYADYAVWQREYLKGDVFDDHARYWRRQLGGVEGKLGLPTDRVRPPFQTYQAGYEKFTIHQETVLELKRAGRREEATLYTVLLAALKVLLYRYCGQKDLSVGTYSANRNRAQLEGLIGFFVNTLVMRSELNPNDTFADVLRREKEVTLGAYAHQDLPFEKLLEVVNVVRSTSHTPLFQVMLVLQNMPKRQRHLGELKCRYMGPKLGRAEFDLTFWVRETAGELVIRLEYRRDLFDASTIRHMADRYQRLLQAVTRTTDQDISEISLLSEEERRKVVEEWNETGVSNERTVLLHELVERQAERRGSEVAVRYEGEEISYGELNRRANQLGNYLRRMGVIEEDVVGICMKRGIGMIVGMMGVMKAGGGYLPLEGRYPRERLRQMVRESGVEVVVSERERKGMAGEEVRREVVIDEEWEEIGKESGERVRTGVSGRNKAYVMYTSGTSGRGKGVCVEHVSAVNFVEWAIEKYGISEQDVVLQFGTISFDGSVEEIYMSLGGGAKLEVRGEEMIGSVEGFLEECRERKITVMDLPTGYWEEVVEEIGEGGEGIWEELRVVVIGGEKVKRKKVEEWRRKVGSKVRLINTYGPTEGTVVATAEEIGEEEEGKEVAIGRPIRNAKIYIRDERGKEVGIGMKGEIYIGGEGVSRG